LVAHAVDLGLHTDVITNGWYVTKENAAKFKESNVGHVSVSVDGMEDVHDDLRNMPGSFHRCVEAIKMLRNAGVRVYLSPTFYKRNLHQLQDLLELADSLGADFSWKVMIPMGQASRLKQYCLSSEEQKKLHEALFVKKSSPDNEMDITTTCNPYSAFLERGGDSVPEEGRIRGGCTGGITLICVGADGTITPCSRLQVPLGNVRENSLEDIWYSSDVLATLRDRDNLKGKCGACRYRNWCGGCRAMAQAWLGDYLAEDPTCWLESEAT
jgi:radical SAM protein with 4Fe4S-binding SPASM domain